MSIMASDKKSQANDPADVDYRDFQNRRFNLFCSKCGRLASKKTWAELRGIVDKHKTKSHHVLRFYSVLEEGINGNGQI